MSEVRESIAVYGANVRPWTVDEYYRAAEKGIFKPGEKLELIQGEVIQKVSPQKIPHAISVQAAAEHLAIAFPKHYIRCQFPLSVDSHSEPEPDVAVVKGSYRDYKAGHPTPSDVLLIVEVADTTIRLDRERKALLYAEFGVPEYWVVNIGKRYVEVFRNPSGEGKDRVYAHSEIVRREAF